MSEYLLAAFVLGGIYLLGRRNRSMQPEAVRPPPQPQEIPTSEEWHGNQHTQDNLQALGRVSDIPTGFKFNAANSPYIIPVDAPQTKGEVPLEQSELLRHVEPRLG